MASMVISSGMSRTSTLQARRLTPLMRMASEPHTPCAHERRNDSEPSAYHLIWCNRLSTRSVGRASTSNVCQCGSVSTSGLNRRILTEISRLTADASVTVRRPASAPQ